MIANPIAARELKERMRTLRVPIVLSVYLLILGMIVFGLERAISSNSQYNPFASALAGRTIFHWLLFFLLLFVCFMVPAFTSGAISSERERQTFHLVQVSLMTPHAIVTGKLMAAMMYLGLLVVATLPLVSISFVLGGVSILDVLRGYGMVLFCGLAISLVGLAISSRIRRTLGSTVLTLLIVAALTVGTIVGYGLVRFAQQRDDPFDQTPDRNPVWTLYLNPFVGTASAIQGADTGGGDTPFEGLFAFLHESDEQYVVAQVAPPAQFQGPGSIPAPSQVGGPVLRRRERTVPIWGWTMGWYVLIGAGAYMLAVGGVVAPKVVFRTGRKRRRGTVEGG